MKTKNVLVIGGSGFLGSHMADKLQEHGHNVTIFDHKESPYRNEGQKLIIGDIMSVDDLRSAMENIDTVYHMAGIADIDECYQNPTQTMEFNIVGTARVLEACVESSIEKFVFSSTAYVYSDRGSFYRVSKQACESLIEEYNKKHGLKYVILRYGSLYGERSDSRNSIYRFLYSAIKHNKLSYGGSGEERREFIHVLDGAELGVKILEEKFDNDVILLTGTRTVKYIELLEIIKEILGNTAEIELLNKTNNNHYMMSPYSYKPNVCRKLSGDYQIDFGQGLLSLIEDIHQNGELE